MNIEIKDFEDLEGNVQTGLLTDPMDLKDLQKLGPVIGRLITMNVKDKANMMAILKQIYTAAGWQIVRDSDGFISEEDDRLSDILLEGYVDEIKKSGFRDLFSP